MQPLKYVYKDLVSTVKEIKQFLWLKNPANNRYHESDSYYSDDDEHEYIYTNYTNNLEIKIVLNERLLYIIYNLNINDTDNPYNNNVLEIYGDEDNIEIENKLNQFLETFIKEKILKLFIGGNDETTISRD